MAQAYVLADNMFTSHIDASFVSHQYIIAGQANSAVDLPTTDWGCGGNVNDTVLTLNQDRTYGPAISPCFNSETLADEAEAQGLTWRYYATASSSHLGYVWSAYQAIGQIYNGPQWTTNVKNPPAAFLKDVAKGRLAAVTWVTPTCATSDHASCLGKGGPDWVASVVNAVGESGFWDDTVVFVMWDEWGGWYDHVPPPYVDYDGLGMRVPLLMISPYAKLGYVTHVQYEHGSILRYVEDNFGLPQMAASDTRANDPAVDAFNYKQKARPFTPIKSQMKADDFIRQPPDPRAPDED
jgi:phospholipase C